MHRSNFVSRIQYHSVGGHSQLERRYRKLHRGIRPLGLYSRNRSIGWRRWHDNQCCCRKHQYGDHRDENAQADFFLHTASFGFVKGRSIIYTIIKIETSRYAGYIK